jgi:hypothetical protein
MHSFVEETKDEPCDDDLPPDLVPSLEKTLTLSKAFLAPLLDFDGAADDDDDDGGRSTRRLLLLLILLTHTKASMTA